MQYVLEVGFPSDVEISIRRQFAAPVELVFEAMTRKEHILRWWGPSGLDMQSCEHDFRVGGAWRYVLGGPDAAGTAFSGEFRVIEPPRRLVQTFAYEPIPEALAMETFSFEALSAGRTLVSVNILHSCKEHRDGQYNSGMESGMQESYGRLDALLRSLTLDA